MKIDIEDINEFNELDNIVSNPNQYRLLCQIMYQGSYDLILITNKLGKIISVNEAGIDFSGFKREEVYGKFLLKLPGVLNKNEFGRCLKVFTDAIRGKPSYDFKTFLVDKTGSKHTMIFNVFPIKIDKKVKYVMLIAKDITEQIQNEKLYRESNQIKTYLNNIIDSTNEVIFGIDLKNKIRTWNNTMISLTGIPLKKVQGKKITSLHIFSNYKGFIQYANQVKKGYNQTYDELIITTKTGREKLLSVSGSIIRDSDGEINGVIFIGRDITGQKILHGRLLPGDCYIKTGEDHISLLYSLNDLIQEGYHGLIVTRFLEEKHELLSKKSKIEIFYLKDRTKKNKTSIQNSTDLVTSIQEFINNHEKSVILLTRLDYLFITESFNSVLKNLYKITGQVKNTDSILLLHLNTKLLTEREQEFFMQEFDTFPTRKMKNISLNDSMYEILEFIYQQQKMKMMVTFKKLGKELSISKSTVAKRVKFLEQNGLIVTVKIGRSKSISLTDQGESIIKQSKKDMNRFA